MASRGPREGRFDIDFAQAQETLTWAVDGADNAVFDLEQGAGTSWPAGAVLTAEVSFDGGVYFRAFPDDGSGTVGVYSSFGQQSRLEVTGATHIRLRNSTATGSVGAKTCTPILSLTRDRP